VRPPEPAETRQPAHRREGGHGLPRCGRTELLPMCTLLLVAGFETTVNLIGNAVGRATRPPQPMAR